MEGASKDPPPPYAPPGDEPQGYGYPQGQPPVYPSSQGYATQPGYAPVESYPSKEGHAPPQAYPQPQQGYGQCYPGQPYGGAAQTIVITQPMMPNPPPDNMVLAVVATICCCWPIGIFAIMKSLECQKAIREGDRPRAEHLSKEARKLGYVTIGVGVAFIIMYIIALIIVFTVVLASDYDY